MCLSSLANLKLKFKVRSQILCLLEKFPHHVEFALGCGQVATWGLVFMDSFWFNRSQLSASSILGRILGIGISIMNKQSKYLPSWIYIQIGTKSILLILALKLSPAYFSVSILGHLPPCSWIQPPDRLLFLKHANLVPTLYVMYLHFCLFRTVSPKFPWLFFSLLSSMIKEPCSNHIYLKKLPQI